MTLKAGIAVHDGLIMLIDDEKDDVKILRLLEFLRNETAEGGTFSAAAKASGQFPKYAVDMFAIGEKTGRLDDVMRALAGYYERRRQINESVRSAVVFPLILFVMIVAVMTVILTAVLPVFDGVFKQLGVESGTFVAGLISAGAVIKDSALLIFAAIIVIAAIAAFCVFNTKVHTRIMAFFAEITKNTKLSKSLSAARFSSSMAMTLASGLDIDESLELSRVFADNSVIRDKIALCRSLITSGKAFNDAVFEAKILAPLYCRMLAISFKTGDTDTVMSMIAKRSEEDANDEIEILVGRIEPIMVGIMAVLVGVVLLSVMFPLLSVMSAI